MNWRNGNRLPFSSIITYMWRGAILNFARMHRQEVRCTWVTGTIIEVFYNQNRIAFHRRLYGRKGQYGTVMEHMPKEHLYYPEWNVERFRKRAEGIGENTAKIRLFTVPNSRTIVMPSLYGAVKASGQAFASKT